MTNVLIITNEASGDQHAGMLAQNLYQKWPDITIHAMGGKRLAEAGATMLIQPKSHSMIGLGGSFAIWRDIIHSYRYLKRFIKQQKPDLVILIDAPAFNLRMAKHAKKAGCKVLYYIGPQLWAWHKSRIKIVKKYIDYMAVILPFEKSMYQQHNVAADYVGHPLMHQVQCHSSKTQAREQLQLPQQDLIIGLAPGSRKAELERIFPIMLQAAVLLKKQQPNVQFLVPVASSFDVSELTAFTKQYPQLPITTITDNRYLAMRACDIVLAKSGTVTLEIALLQIPMIIVYMTSNWIFRLGKWLVDLPHLGLCNVVAGKTIVPELIQHDFTAKSLSDSAQHLLQNQQKQQVMLQEMQKLKTILKPEAGVADLMAIIESLLENKNYE